MTLPKEYEEAAIVTRQVLCSRQFLATGGIETYLCFQQGFELPEFCAFVLFDDAHAEELTKYESTFLSPMLLTAAEAGQGFVLDCGLWRAHPEFLEKLGRDSDDLLAINRRAVARTKDFVKKWREDHGYTEEDFKVLFNADIGPCGDAYNVKDVGTTVEMAREYHSKQIAAVAEAGVDIVTALTMSNVGESIGIVQACMEQGLPVIVSPTVETDGRLPDGQELEDLIRRTDEATDSAPIFYMVNCAHPSHLFQTLEKAGAKGEKWLDRFKGFRTNASCKSHEELDNSTVLDRGDILELSVALKKMHAEYNLRIVGGCCGTDHEHIQAISRCISDVSDSPDTQ
uniref:Hcy-binding domain-containing protein n=1 Tax=Odontella aurita TaxID=265563 RepID=A0A7S4MY83_9STRA|mmetsp:Transcript_39517/g.118615  ORF Transcript_39517/g.118615 Transcript_39517/m.118615 type:complete len:342 (+) Transcript_39517:67-1092(+)